MPTSRPFQIVLIVAFAFLALASLVLIRFYKAPSSTAQLAYGEAVTIWGTLPYQTVKEVLNSITDKDDAFSVVDYVYVRPETFSNDLVNAIAEGRSPDLVILPHTELVRQRSKLLPIPYTTTGFSEREIKSRFIDGAEIFALNDGLYAIPLLVDPLLMYWNRDLLASAGFANPPQTWEQLVGSYITTLTKQDAARALNQSTVAFGEYRNVENAYGVLSVLLLQAGSKMVSEQNNKYVVELNDNVSSGRPPLESVLQFYADFANPASSLYTWNRALPQDQLQFIGGSLALYFGHTSEAPYLEDKNPNLNFDVAIPPQGSGATVQRDYGTFYGLAIPRASSNHNGAFNAAVVLAKPENQQKLARALTMVPVERSLMGSSDGAFEAVTYQAALIARGWLSPNLSTTNSAFQTMVEDVASNRSTVSEAVRDALDRIILAY